MPHWSALTEYLAASANTCRLTWGELTGIVGELPPSASNHRAWWSGDRTQVRVWRSAGFRLAAVSLGDEVTFVREGSPAQAPSVPPPVDIKVEAPGRLEIETEPTSADIVLVSCSKTKVDHPAAARELYNSPLFRQSRAYAEASGRPWFILSAEHGLVGPDQWLAPYERYLPDTPPGFRDAWGHWVVERLELLMGDLAGSAVEVHAGAAYVEPIANRLRAKGCELSLPLEGLSLGARRHWYAVHADAASHPTEPVDSKPEAQLGGEPEPLFGGDQTATAFAAMLRDEAKALPPAEFLSRGPAGLKVPGLYSWWADEQAAADLSDGAGPPCCAGHDLRRARGSDALAEWQAVHEHSLVAHRGNAPRQAP